jgi:lysophospholipid hydrolase
LEILLPEEKNDNDSEHNKSPNLMSPDDDFPSTREQTKSKLLFTVKPGGIAGYLGELLRIQLTTCVLNARLRLASLCSTPSYVDIKAKTDTFVGFLPSHALERLLEKRPIVLLTLAKRLISLLSPLGRCYFREQ